MASDMAKRVSDGLLDDIEDTVRDHIDEALAEARAEAEAERDRWKAHAEKERARADAIEAGQGHEDKYATGFDDAVASHYSNLEHAKDAARAEAEAERDEALRQRKFGSQGAGLALPDLRACVRFDEGILADHGTGCVRRLASGSVAASRTRLMVGGIRSTTTSTRYLTGCTRLIRRPLPLYPERRARPMASDPRPICGTVRCTYCPNPAYVSGVVKETGRRTFGCRHCAMSMLLAGGFDYEGPLPEESEAMQVLRRATDAE